MSVKDIAAFVSASLLPAVQNASFFHHSTPWYQDAYSHSAFAGYTSLQYLFYCYISSKYKYLFYCHMIQDKWSPTWGAIGAYSLPANVFVASLSVTASVTTVTAGTRLRARSIRHT